MCKPFSELTTSSGYGILASMIDQALNVAEFPFVERLPKREKSRLHHVWDCLQELRQVIDEKGIPIQQLHASKLLGVSKQRVAELIDLGRLEVVEVDGVRFVTERSIVALSRTERKAGRPVKIDRDSTELGAARAAWAVSKDYAKELVRVKK